MRPSLNTILFNAAGLGVVLFVGGYMVSSLFHTEQIARCSARYGNGQQFALQDGSGAPLSPLELQARVPTREWGLLTSARVVEAQDKSAQFLQVALGPQPADAASAEQEEEGTEAVADGVGFLWSPDNLDGARSACLSYRVYLPKDFSFAGPGTLPGFYAVTNTAEIDKQQPEAGFVSRIGWQKGGGLGIDLRTPLSPGMWVAARAAAWPVGRWVSVEQEVVLNAPDKQNGTLRLWIDGELLVENPQLNLGAKDQLTLSGVVADVGYAKGTDASGRVTLSPFIVQRH